MNNIQSLRDSLFETLQRLKAGTIDVDRAKAVNETAQVIINSVKVEIDHMRIAGGSCGFVEINAPALGTKAVEVKTGNGVKTVTQLPAGGTITRHKMT
jgi:hypothetical protein